MGNAGTASSATNYATNLFTSAVPSLTNFSSLNGLNSAANFTASFNGFTTANGTTSGSTLFAITTNNGTAVFLNSEDPSTTDIVIPANTLSPDTTYNFQLDFRDTLAGTGGITQLFDERTDGTFTTGAATAPAVPLPATLPLFASGIGGLGLLGWRRKRRTRVVA